MLIPESAQRGHGGTFTHKTVPPSCSPIFPFLQYVASLSVHVFTVYVPNLMIFKTLPVLCPQFIINTGKSVYLEDT